MTGDWQDEALCAEVGGDFWFPENGASAGVAKRICGECTVAAVCVEYAIENDINYGMFGGLSPADRARIRRERNRRTA